MRGEVVRDEVRCIVESTGQQVKHAILVLLPRDTVALGKSFSLSGISLYSDLKKWLLT